MGEFVWVVSSGVRILGVYLDQDKAFKMRDLHEGVVSLMRIE